jgi:hypothetical protein
LKVSTGRTNPVKVPVVLFGVPGLLLGNDRELTSCRLQAKIRLALVAETRRVLCFGSSYWWICVGRVNSIVGGFKVIEALNYLVLSFLDL